MIKIRRAIFCCWCGSVLLWTAALSCAFADDLERQIALVGRYQSLSDEVLFSPDGAWLAYCGKTEEGGFRLHLRPLGEAEELEVPADVVNGSRLVWSDDSRFLAWYVMKQGEPVTVAVFDTTNRKFTKGAEVALPPLSHTMIPCWTPDATRLVFLKLVAPYPEIETREDALGGTIHWPEGTVVEAYRSKVRSRAAAGSEELALSDAGSVRQRMMQYGFGSLSAKYPAELVALDPKTLDLRTVLTGIAAYPRQFMEPADRGGRIIWHSQTFGFDRNQQVLFLLDLDSTQAPLAVDRLSPLVTGHTFTQRAYTRTADHRRAALISTDIKGRSEALWVIDFESDSLIKAPALDIENPRPANRLAGGQHRPDFVTRSNTHWSFDEAPTLWAPDGKSVVFLAEGMIGRYLLERGRLELLSQDVPTYFTAHGGWVEPGRSVLVSYAPAGPAASGVGIYDLDTATLRVLREEPSFWMFADSNPSQGLLFHSAGDIPDELYTVDKENPDAPPQVISSLNPGFAAEDMGERPQVLKWNVHGKEASGYIVFPRGSPVARDGKLPLIVYPYPEDNPVEERYTFNSLDLLMRLAVMRGYAVLMPGMPLPGPDEEGANFLRDVNTAVNAAADAAIATGRVDPERMGLIGHSWGGYLVFAVICQSTRFKAAVAGSGYGDPTMAYLFPNEQGVMHGDKQFNASPWGNPQRYTENSVIYKLHQIETPVMIVHGQDDQRVRPEESLMVYRGLAQLGKSALLLQYRESGHNYNRWPEPARLDFFTRFIQWMDDYVAEL